MTTLRYTAILEAEEGGGYHAFCPALRGCHSYGDTAEAATAGIREAIEAYLEDLQAEGEPLPREDFLLTAVEVSLM